MKSKKLFVIIALMLTFTTTISASSSLKQIKAFIHNDLTVVLNKEVFINNPVIYNNTTYVPVREVAKAFHSKLTSDSKNNLLTITPSPELEKVPFKDAQVTYYSSIGNPLTVSKDVTMIVKAIEAATNSNNEQVVTLTVQITNNAPQNYFLKPNFYFELEDVSKELEFNNQLPSSAGPEYVKPNHTQEYQFIYEKLPQSPIVRVSYMINRISDLTWVTPEPIHF